MKVACVLITDFRVAVELLHRPQLAGRPIVVGGLPHERKPVLACSPEAAAYAIAPGVSLRQAHSLCPTATFLPPEEDRYRQSFAVILRVLDGFSPFVEGHYPGLDAGARGCGDAGKGRRGDRRSGGGRVRSGRSFPRVRQSPI